MPLGIGIEHIEIVVGIVRLQGGLDGGLTGVGDGRGGQALVGIQVIGAVQGLIVVLGDLPPGGIHQGGVDLQQAVHGTLHLLRPLAAKSDVTLTCLMSDGVTVRASEDDIYHIVFNLVENAIKYNLPGGSVTVRVEAHGEQSILSVADTGIGIPEADRPNLFNRFYRVDKARSREHGGSGLGLSIVHDAAALYGGTVTVDGVEPHGTRFTVTFPRAAADDAPEAQKEVPET